MFGKRAIEMDIAYSMQFEDIQSRLRDGSVFKLHDALDSIPSLAKSLVAF
jgi:hypothetical protein